MKLLTRASCIMQREGGWSRGGGEREGGAGEEAKEKGEQGRRRKRRGSRGGGERGGGAGDKQMWI